MNVPLELDLKDFMTKESQEVFCSSTSIYKFSASVNHAGSAGFGHYWSIVVGPDGNYYKLDDELVTEVNI